jgi:hypothetical protein
MQATNDWQRLVAALDAWSSATEIAPARIEVALPQDQAGRVVVVMTPTEWEEMSGVMWGSFEDALGEVKQTLSELQPHERFAVYSQYRLAPSVEPTLPRSARPAPAPGGTWATREAD